MVVGQYTGLQHGRGALHRATTWQGSSTRGNNVVGELYTGLQHGRGALHRATTL